MVQEALAVAPKRTTGESVMMLLQAKDPAGQGEKGLLIYPI